MDAVKSDSQMRRMLQEKEREMENQEARTKNLMLRDSDEIKKLGEDKSRLQEIIDGLNLDLVDSREQVRRMVPEEDYDQYKQKSDKQDSEIQKLKDEILMLADQTKRQMSDIEDFKYKIEVLTCENEELHKGMNSLQTAITETQHRARSVTPDRKAASRRNMSDMEKTRTEPESPTSNDELDRESPF